MKIHIFDEGDRSVGIGSSEMDIELNWNIPNTKQEREELRKIFIEFAKNSLDFCNDRVSGYFSDECPDCFSILKDNKCTNKNCITYGY